MLRVARAPGCAALSQRNAGPVFLRGFTFAAVLALATLTAPTAGAQATDAAQLEAAVTTGLDALSPRAGPRVSLDPTGDATVIFAIRDEDDNPATIRAGALTDTLSVLRTVYQSPQAGHVRTLTVLGTFPFKGTKGRSVRESPVLRAVLSADHAAQLSWDQLSPEALPATLDVWWLQGAFANVDAEPPALDDVSPAPNNDLLVRLDVARAHLLESRRALDAGQVGIGRSQFKQFFDVWDELDEPIAQRYPAQYDLLDVELERAEVALLHTQPEDVATATAALDNIATNLDAITQQLGPDPLASDGN